MEEDAVRIVQRDGHIPATDGPGTPILEDHIERLEEVFSCMRQAG